MRRFRIPPLVFDTVLAVALLVAGFFSRAEIMALDGVPFTRDPDVVNSVLIILMTVPLIMRRRAPLIVMAVVLGAWTVDRYLDYPGTLASAGVVLAMHAVGTEVEPRLSARIGYSVAGVIALYTVFGAFTLDSVGIEDAIFMFIAIAAPLALGREIHIRRQRVQALEERVARAEDERERRARQAVREERTRIARELHDVVAHQMTVMTLQAEGALRVAPGSDERVLGALETIRTSGHEALDEMRRMVGLLRTDADVEGAPLLPQPGLAQIDELITSMRDSGLDVTVTESGARPTLSGGVDLNVFRIVQESLTNALKHGGPGVSATVKLTYAVEQVEIEVLDDGRGAAERQNGSGHGLIGMKERAALLDGTVLAGPKSGGGYRVHATIPLPA